MNELERKLAETLRTQAGEIKPDPRAWLEHQRRVQAAKRSRRPLLIAVAGVAVVLALLIAVLPRLGRSEVQTAGPGPQPGSVRMLLGPFRVASTTVDDSVWDAYFARVQYPGAEPSVYDCFYAVPRSSGTRDLPDQPSLPGYPKCDSDPAPAGPNLLTSPLSAKVLSHRVYVVSPQVAALTAFSDDDAQIPVSEVARSTDLAVFVAVSADKPVRFVGLDAQGMVISAGTSYPIPRGAQ